MCSTCYFTKPFILPHYTLELIEWLTDVEDLLLLSLHLRSFDVTQGVNKLVDVTQGVNKLVVVNISDMDQVRKNFTSEL